MNRHSAARTECQYRSQYLTSVSSFSLGVEFAFLEGLTSCSLGVGFERAVMIAGDPRDSFSLATAGHPVCEHAKQGLYH